VIAVGLSDCNAHVGIMSEIKEQRKLKRRKEKREKERARSGEADDMYKKKTASN
jgi:hypothetical protein